MARVEETETTFDGIPEGKYVAFFAGFVPRDEDTMRPRFIEKDEWKKKQKTGNKIPAVLWSFEVVHPEAFRGEPAPGSTPWKNIKVTQNQKGENVVQVERIGTMIPYLIKWSEVCGVDWTADLSGLPEKGPITDQMIAEALDAALLNHAREGAMQVLKVGERGYVDSSQSDCVMPLPAGPEAKKVEGIVYTVPDFYGVGGFPAGAVVGGSWAEEDLEAMRQHIRVVLHPALTAGDSILTLEEAKEKRWLAQAMQLGDDYAARALHLAQSMVEGEYDAMETNLLVRVISILTGAPVAGKIVDSLAPPQLEGAVRHLTDMARALGKEVPDAPVPSAPPDEDELDMPF